MGITFIQIIIVIVISLPLVQCLAIDVHADSGPLVLGVFRVLLSEMSFDFLLRRGEVLIANHPSVLQLSALHTDLFVLQIH